MQKHPWLKLYPIKEESKSLIIGTHPPMPYCTDKVQFYYGNMNEFWRLLSLVYHEQNIFPNENYSLEKIQSFLDEHKFSITDMVYKTENEKFSTDYQMKVKELNPCLKEWLERSMIEQIFFTSFNSGKNSALSLFKRWLKENKIHHDKIPPVKSWISNGISVKINKKTFKLIALYSPSPAARRGIPKSKPFLDWKNNTNCISNCVDSFRVYWYKKFFQN